MVRTFRSIIVVTLVAALMCVAAGAAFAAKGGSGAGGVKTGHGGKTPPVATGSFSLVLVDSTDGVAHWGQHVTFDATSSAQYFFVQVDCSQGGTVVYQQALGFYVGWAWTRNFTLMSGAWTGGAAECGARLYASNSDGSNPQTLATLTFSAAA
jgi:hypothetical protein